MKKSYNNSAVYANSTNPCKQCGKPDWCYFIGDLNVCNRDVEASPGWYRTSKKDKDGHYFYAPTNDKQVARKQTRYWEYPDRDGNKLVRIVRIDDGLGGKPKRWQEHWNGSRWVKGLKGIDRKDIPLYRYAEVMRSAKADLTVFLVEGEKCADALWDLGIPATTNIGGCGRGKFSDSDFEDLSAIKFLVLSPDRDKPGINHMLAIAERRPDAKWCYAPPSEFFWIEKNLPDSKGLDIADWIADGADEESVKSRITDESPVLFGKSLAAYGQEIINQSPEKNREVIIEAEEIFTMKAVDCLYSDTSYIAIHDKLYKWSGTHYEEASTARERRRILEWCKNTPVEIKGRWKYALAKPETVNKIWIWVLTCFAVDSEEVNPPGINCLNGVIQISWQGHRVSHELVPHDPKFYFTHVANFSYDSQADDRDCNRLLAALDPGQQEIFLKTIAASLDLNTIRKYQGRAVKALLCQGTGSNGKDTLREAVRAILGSGMTSASVTDFQQYDQGRKFPLVKIEHSLINWSSENSHFARLDSLQGLKAAITGESIDIEPKNSIEYPINPRGIFLFNVNESPLLEGGMEAISSRWAVLSFNKTFKKNANPLKGELEADSRFRYDPDFLETNVCPALINKILDRLQTVVTEGIDYSCCDDGLRKIQEQSNHLWQFVNEMGIAESPGDRLYISDLWERLQAWYIDQGTLEIYGEGENTKKVWQDQPRKSDRNITGINQISRRFAELFPNVEKRRHTETDDTGRKGQNYLNGLVVLNISSGEASGEAKTTVYQGGEDGEAKLRTLATLVKEIKRLPSPERLTAIKIMNEFIQSEPEPQNSASPSSPQDCISDSASPSSSPSSSPEVCDNVAINNNTNTATNEHTEKATAFALSISQAIEMPITNSNTVHHYENQPIEWVKLQDDRILLISHQDGRKLTGRESGSRKHESVAIDDCAEIHYKEQEKPPKRSLQLD